jgi:hypothetical protein
MSACGGEDLFRFDASCRGVSLKAAFHRSHLRIETDVEASHLSVLCFKSNSALAGCRPQGEIVVLRSAIEMRLDHDRSAEGRQHFVLRIADTEAAAGLYGTALAARVAFQPGDGVLGLCRAVVAYRFDAVAIRIDDERSIVVRVILRP